MARARRPWHAGQGGAALKKCVLELGGSDPFIVMPDADLDAAAKAAAAARTINAGQSCIAAKRFIVVGDSHEFEKHFAQALAELKVGNPSDRATADRPAGAPGSAGKPSAPGAGIDPCRRARRHRRPSPAGERIFLRPDAAVFANVRKPGMTVLMKKPSGPVAALTIEAKDLDDAIRLANLSRYGLGARAWHLDEGHQSRCTSLSLTAGFDSGCVFINGAVKSDPRLPFGGVKRSGYRP